MRPGVLFLGLLIVAACGDAGGDDAVSPDAREIPDARCGAALRESSCNEVANTGCSAGEKCTWIRIDTSLACGVVGCVPDGDVPLDGACEFGPDGEVTGFDDCVGGAICVDAVCRQICTLSPDSCQDGLACTDHPDLFIDRSPAVGACEPPP